MKKPSISVILFLLINACSPTKGYLGPERPPEELSVIYYDSCDSNVNLIKASSEGVEFGSSGIELLPGKRVIDVTIERPLRPFNCVPQTKFDEYGYQSCMDRRFKAISKNDKYVPECYTSSYTTTSYFCNQEFQSFVCTNSHELVKGWKYNTCSYQQGMEVFLKIIYKDKTGPIIPATKCQQLGSEVRNVEFSYMP